MKKIIKRANWSQHSKPYLPSAPVQPQKTRLDVVETELENFDNYCRYDLRDLKLPAGKTFADVAITIDGYPADDFAGGVDIKCRFLVTEIRTIENPHYESEMKRYEKALFNYQIKKTNHKNEVNEWKLWIKQKKEEFQLKQIEHAKKVLKDAGFKV